MLRDTLVLGLQALAESADVFPPLKSAVCGLLFLSKQIELVTSNKSQIQAVYARIDGFAASLTRAIPDATALSPEDEAAIHALAKDVENVCADVRAIASHPSSLRFIRARQHSGDISELMAKLDRANESFTRTIMTSTKMDCTKILACVEPMREDGYAVNDVSGLIPLGALKQHFNVSTSCVVHEVDLIPSPWRH
ncbi:unnamed protein product [Peniophora sp. CBMAI 1063]|nr:unnamed protein product [Peniophora sp. CBMAI 1063]